MKRALALGALLGALVATLPMGLWGEFANRVSARVSDGAGERSDWGEVAFYLALAALPGSLLGGTAGALGWWAKERLRRRE